MPQDHDLAIDFGTTYSAAAVSTPRGPTSVTLDSASSIPSAVFRDADGSLVVGEAALNQAVLQVDRLQRTPKSYLGRRALVLGGTTVPSVQAAGAVIGAFVQEAKRLHGGQAPRRVGLTYPARWQDVRRTALLSAAEQAGLDPKTVTLVPEPVAAAAHYVDNDVPVGAAVVVYDLGGGTFDTAVLRRTADGFEIAGEPGGDDTIGGEDFDHRVYRFAGDRLAADDPEMWRLLDTSDELQWRRNGSEMRTWARKAKELLSVKNSASIYVPCAGKEYSLSRDEFEAMIADDIARTVDTLADTVDGAGLTADQLHAVYLVGGSSRIPLVGRELTNRFGGRVTTRDDPKAVVALGAIRILERGTATTAKPAAAAGTSTKAAPTSTPKAADTSTKAAFPPVPPPDGATVTQGEEPPEKKRNSSLPVLAGLAVAAVVAVIVGVVVSNSGSSSGSSSGSGYTPYYGSTSTTSTSYYSTPTSTSYYSTPTTTASSYAYPDSPPSTGDYTLDQYADACYSGSASACNTLYENAPVGSTAEEYGATCGGRFPNVTRGGSCY